MVLKCRLAFDVFIASNYFQHKRILNINTVHADDHNLACISAASKNDKSPYLNSSIIQAYAENQYFVVAQDPISKNVYLFWRYIMDNNIKYVVRIDDVRTNLNVYIDCFFLITYNSC